MSYLSLCHNAHRHLSITVMMMMMMMIMMITCDGVLYAAGTSYAGFSHVESQNRANPFFAKMNEGGFRRTGPFLVVARPDDSLGKVLEMITEHGEQREESAK